MKTNREILEIFGEYEKVVAELSEIIAKGETSGLLEWYFFKEDYEDITEEMNELFKEQDCISIFIEWNLSIE